MLNEMVEQPKHETPDILYSNDDVAYHSPYFLPITCFDVDTPMERPKSPRGKTFTLPEVLDVRLPPSPERHRRTNSSTQGSELRSADIRSKSALPGDPTYSKPVAMDTDSGDRRTIDTSFSDRPIDDFVKRIPDLSFMLSSTLVLPKGS